MKAQGRAGKSRRAVLQEQAEHTPIGGACSAPATPGHDPDHDDSRNQTRKGRQEMTEQPECLVNDETGEKSPPIGTPEFTQWNDERLVKAAANFTDEQIRNRWCDVGEALWPRDRELFEMTFAAAMSQFTSAPDEARVPTLENWNDAGGRLIAGCCRELIFLIATKLMLMRER